MDKKLHVPEVWCWSFREKEPKKILFSDLDWSEGRDEKEKTALIIGKALLDLKLKIPVVLVLCTCSGNNRTIEVEKINEVKVTDEVYDTTFIAPKDLFLFELSFDELKIKLLIGLKAYCEDRFDFFGVKRADLLEKAEVLGDKIDAFESLKNSLPVFEDE